MAGVNKAILVGNLGKDPEMRYTQSGQGVTRFSLATTESYKDRDGQRQQKTEWHNIVAWGKLGEICAQYLKKGRSVFIEGRIQNRSWDDRDGNKRYITEIVARDMVMLGRAGDGDSRPSSAPPGEEPPESDPAGESLSGDDDIPF